MTKKNITDPIFPVERPKNWRKQGECNIRGEQPEKYLPEKKNSRDTKHYDKSACEACVMKEACLDFALANRAKFGLWGGTTPRQRESMYARYQGEREYELDLDRILFPRRPVSRDIPIEDYTVEGFSTPVRDYMAPEPSLHRSYGTPVFTQCTLFEFEGGEE